MNIIIYNYIIPVYIVVLFAVQQTKKKKDANWFGYLIYGEKKLNYSIRYNMFYGSYDFLKRYRDYIQYASIHYIMFEPCPSTYLWPMGIHRYDCTSIGKMFIFKIRTERC